MTTRIPFNDSWDFTPHFDEDFLSGGGEDLQKADLPHTCVQTPFHYFDESVYQMISGYRKTLRVPEEWAGKRLFIRFEGAAHYAEVYANGNKILSHASGYTAFEAELTPFMQPGKDLTVTVSVNSKEDLDQPPFGHVIDYMTYGGLYREVSLFLRDRTYIEDLFVIPEIPEGCGLLSETDSAESAAKVSFCGKVRAEINVFGTTPDRAVMRVLAPDGVTVLSEDERPYAPKLSLDVAGVGLWDVLCPKLYFFEITLFEGEKPLDQKTVRFGFRRALFRKDGFFLNGRRLKIRGLNRHQSYPYVGYAMPASQQRLDADILKNELGVNAVRTSHYPQSQHFIDRCDELGLLVFTEIPGWQHVGGQAWRAQALKNVEEMVMQYRNHPSIILWGVRINESQDQDELYARTNALSHQLDPTRQTGGVRYIKKSRLLEDVYTYNDFLHSGDNPGVEKRSRVTPDLNKPYLITEYGGHMFPTKPYDCEAHRLEHALRHAKVLDGAAAENEISGTFGWCFFDYNTHKDFGSGDRVCYHGVCDMFRNPKMAAAVYSAIGREEPFLEVSGSMDIGEHPGGFRGRLFAFTNADSVKVYKNGSFIREYTHADSPYKNLARAPIEIDDLIGDQIKAEGFSKRKEKLVRDALNLYARCGGKHMPPSFYFKMLCCVLFHRMKYSDAYALYGKYLGNWGDSSVVYRFDACKDGETVLSVLKNPMHEMRLELLPDRSDVVWGESYEAVLVRARVVDENGCVLPFYMGQGRVETEGPLCPLGSDLCRIEGGAGGFYLRTLGAEGKATVTVTLPEGQTARVTLNVCRDQTAVHF